jgi:hypothetical protein
VYTKGLWQTLLDLWRNPTNNLALKDPKYLRGVASYGLPFWPAARTYRGIMDAEGDRNLLSRFPLVRLAHTMLVVIRSLPDYSLPLTTNAAEVW